MGKGVGRGTLPGAAILQAHGGLRIWGLACILRSRQSDIQGEPGRGGNSSSEETSIHLLDPAATPMGNHELSS